MSSVQAAGHAGRSTCAPSTVIRWPRWARWCLAFGAPGARGRHRCRSCSACTRPRPPRAKASLLDDVWRQLKQTAAVKFCGLRSRRPPLLMSVTTWHGFRVPPVRAATLGTLVCSVTLLLRRQAPVWTRLWHEDVRLSHGPIHYVCLCLQDEPSVIAQQARLLLVFHGLLLGHRHRLRPQADQGFRVSAAGLHNPGFRNGFNAAKRGRFAAKPLIWWAIDRSKVRVLVRPPPSPVQIRFPAVSERTPGFPRHSRRPERRSRLCGGKGRIAGPKRRPVSGTRKPFPSKFYPHGRRRVRMSTETGSHSWPAAVGCECRRNVKCPPAIMPRKRSAPCGSSARC
jgi:hypothetical protein